MDPESILALEERVTLYEHAIDTLLLLATRMNGHPHRSVRAFSASIQRVLGPFADPPLEREFDESIVLPGGVSVSQTVGAFLRRWGDDLEGEDRWAEGDFAVRDGLGAESGPEAIRAWLCTDWLVRIHTASWIRLAGMAEEANQLLALRPIDGAAALKESERIVRGVAERAERLRSRLSSGAARPEGRGAGREPGPDEPGSRFGGPGAELVQVARSAWSVGAAGAAVEAGAAWCPQASRATEAAIWIWALRRADVYESDPDLWRTELQVHVDTLQRSAIELIEELLLLSPPEVRRSTEADRT